MNKLQMVLILLVIDTAWICSQNEFNVHEVPVEYVALEHTRYFGHKPDSDINTIASQTTAKINIAPNNGVSIGDYAAVYQVGDLIVNNDAGIEFNTNGALNGISHTASSADIVIAKTGKYLIEYIVSFVGNIDQSSNGGAPDLVLFPAFTGAPIDFQLNVNGSDVSNTLIRGEVFGIMKLACSGILSLSAGDIIQVRNKTGVSVTLVGPGVFFTAASIILCQIA